MKSTVDIVFKAGESFQDTGGYLKLQNDTNVRLYGSSIPVIWDIVELLNLTVIPHFEDWYPAVDSVCNGSSDWGASLMSVGEGLLNRPSCGAGIVFLHPLVSVSSDIFFRQPPPENIHTTVFRPFQLSVWISIFVFMITGSLLTYFLHNTFKTYESPYRILTNVVLGTVQFLLGRSSPQG